MAYKNSQKNYGIGNKNKEQAQIAKRIGGFTLVEIIVSLAVFSVVAVVALGALIRIIDANRKAQTLQSALTNLNFALESMSREMRVGTKYYCDSGSSMTIPNNEISASHECPSGGSLSGTSGGTAGAYVAFNSSKQYTGQGISCNLIYAYRFRPSDDGVSFVLEKGIQSECQTPIQSFSPVVDEKVVITDYFLRVTGDTFPLMTLRLSGYAGNKEKDKTYFDVETSVSSRVP